MSLVNLRTNLKSLKFGKDRPGENSSKQPYITTPIPTIDEELPGANLGGDDFLLRGGISAPLEAADDVVRLTKYFSDFSNIKGPLFIAKQNILSQISVKSQASGKGPNEGVYTPLNTLAQAGVGFIGGHIDKQGINPFKGVTLYGPAGVKNTNANTVINQVIGDPDGTGNRLVGLYNTQVPHQGNDFSLENPVNVLSYSGGPNSNVGIGKTNIKFATNNKGEPVLTGIATSDYQAGLRENPTGLFKAPLGVTTKYVELNGGGNLIAGGQVAYDTVDGEVLAEISKENGITWVNVDGTPPSPKLQNPTELFINPVGDDATSMYMFTTGEFVSGDLTSDDGVSWQQTLTNPYATGTKGTLATKTYINRNNRTSNPLSEFKIPVNASLEYNTNAGIAGLPTSEFVVNTYEKNDGISWRPGLTNPYTTGIKGSLSDKKYVPRNFNLKNPQGLFEYDNTQTPLKLFAFNNIGYKGLANDNIINGFTNWEVNPFLKMPNVTGTKSLSTNKYVNIGARKASYGQNNDNFSPISEITKASNEWERVTGQSLYPTGTLPILINSNINSPKAYTFELNAITSVYKEGTLNPSSIIVDPSKIGYGYQNFKTLTQPEIYSTSKELTTAGQGAITNFRSAIINPKRSTIMSIAPGYTGKAIIDNNTGENNYHYTSPGQKGNIISYTEGKILKDGSVSVVDKINAYPIYQSEQARADSEVGDLVNFRIGAINQSNPKLKDYIHFRAYIDSFGDNYTGNWDSIKYMGRGESFYKYNSFERKINLSFTVAAQSREELHEQYQKLNYLVSNLAPDYSSEGYMAGSLVTLTMGNWCFELPGFIEQLSLDIPEESPWEIGIDDKGERDNEEGIMQLPHIIKVTGFSFQPIHTFRPAKEKLKFVDVNTKGPGQKEGDLSQGDGRGKEIYLAYRGKIPNPPASTTIKDKTQPKKDIKPAEDLTLQELQTTGFRGDGQSIGTSLIQNDGGLGGALFANDYSNTSAPLFNFSVPTEIPVGTDNNEFSDYNKIPIQFSSKYPLTLNNE